MSMGSRKDSQGDLFISPADLPTGEGHVFYEKLNQLLSKHQFDKQVEDLCRPVLRRRQPRGSSVAAAGGLLPHELHWLL